MARLADEKVEFNTHTVCTVIAASGGYPEDYEKNKVIKGLDTVGGNSLVFHAGTKQVGNEVLSNGGRVLAVTSFGDTILDAVAASNHALERITYDKKYYRRDIGYEFK
jgi:phosphoribosylamine--glycine ligase